MLNSPKLIVICLIIVCATAALMASRLEAVEWIAIVGPFGGYLVGNGVAARNGQTSEPVIAPRRNDDDRP